MKTILVTGGAGFIGSNLIRTFAMQNMNIIVLDYVRENWNRRNFCELAQLQHLRMLSVDLRDRQKLESIFIDYSPVWVVHLAAESHVDKSILSPDEFIESNIIGTYTLIDIATKYWEKNGKINSFRFHYCSTDEVYGSCQYGLFHEEMPLHPNNPYSATKAAGEHFVTAWANTHGLPVLITRCSNNYGPYQGPDKFIPLTIHRCLRSLPVLIHGDGKNIRDWIYVHDHVLGIQQVLKNGDIGEIYNIGGGVIAEKSNLEIAELICDTVDELCHRKQRSRELIAHVVDRPGNDLRYSMNSKKLHMKTGWQPSMPFDEGLKQTVSWYIKNNEYL